LLWLGSALSPVQGQNLPLLRVSENHRFLATGDGEPFFYLADTAWEIFHRLRREEVTRYLDVRAGQGFNVIQAVAIAEFGGLTVPNAYGDVPLVDGDPLRPSPGYWEYVDWVIEQANRRGLSVALLPSWGGWVVKQNPDDHPIFTVETAFAYGRFLGARYRGRGVLWMLGGDRTAEGVQDIWHAMARGIAIGLTGREDYAAAIFLFHPRGGFSSSAYFPDGEPWLTVRTLQTGHGLASETRCWDKIAAEYARNPVKPVIDAESLYEDHPIAFRSKLYGYSFDAHIRQRAYWDVFSGAAGQTYGNHAVWQFYAPGRLPINGPLMYWMEAIERPGGGEMRHLKALMLSRPYFSRVPDPTLVLDALSGSDHIVATRGDGYAFLYTPQGRPFTAVLGRISGTKVAAWWFNPRSGDAQRAGEYLNRGTKRFTPPSEGFGSDWVLVLDDAGRRWSPPGAGPVRRGSPLSSESLENRLHTVTPVTQ
jgi:hypothetical protein